MEGNQLISRSSSSSSGLSAGRRLRTWAVAAAVVCGTVGSSGAVAAETAAVENGAASQSAQSAGPWLDAVSIRGLEGITGPVVFHVTARRGVPWIYDPRVPSGTTRWQNLRRVPGSSGGYVHNITVAEGDPTTAPVVAGRTALISLKITARTASGIYHTNCTIQDDATPPAAPFVNVVFPSTGALTNCTPWAAVPATTP
jgi:hypothetical protein